MDPLEQQRIQTHIRDWDSLTPDQRKQARKKYQKIKKLPPEKRLEIKKKWRKYQEASKSRRKNLK